MEKQQRVGEVIGTARNRLINRGFVVYHGDVKAAGKLWLIIARSILRGLLPFLEYL